MKIISSILFLAFLVVINPLKGQEDLKNSYEFTNMINLKHTPVKDQYKSGTCWSFATISFLESELLRIDKGTYDLSELFFVYHAYDKKAEKYVRYHGSSNFGPGGQAHDVLNLMKIYGLVTQEEFSGMLQGETKPDHGEFDAVLQGFLKAVVSNSGSKLSSSWHDAYIGILNAYMGEVPSIKNDLVAKNNIKGQISTLGINPDDYIELTSYTHHPFFTSFPLEIPDNWSNSLYDNIPIDNLIEIIHNSLKEGYTVCWDGDVSDKGFSHKNGLAIVPEIQPLLSDGTEMSKWDKLSDKEKNDLIYNFKEIRAEKLISQEMRQEAFNNYQATDDHLMHIVGLSQDQNGKKYFITKNSWSVNSNSYGGLVQISESYARLNTIAILVHKNAIPSDLKKKLGL